MFTRQVRRKLAILAGLLGLAGLITLSPVGPIPAALASTTTTVIAGNGTQGYNGNSTATSAELSDPQGVAVDTSGNVYIGDTYNEYVAKVTPGGTISTLYGTPGTIKGESHGGLYHPSGVAVDAYGDTFISDTLNSVVWEVNSSGASVYAGMVNGQYATGTNGLNQPAGLTVGSNGTLYIVDQYNCEVKAVTSAPYMTVVAGNGTCGYSTGSGVATSAELNYPAGVAEANGTLYIADTSNCRIREVNLSTNAISTIAGTGSCGDSGDGGAATSAHISAPSGVAVDAAGAVFLGGSSGAVREITLDNKISTVTNVGHAILSMAIDGNADIYVTTANSEVQEVSGPTGSATVGSITAAVHPDSPLYTMRFNVPVSGVSCPAAVTVTFGTASSSKSMCAAGGTAPSSANLDVSVLSLNPNTSSTATAFIDDTNGVGASGSSSITTPPVPVWVATGDSFSAGWHQDTDQPCTPPWDTATCLDPSNPAYTSLTQYDLDYSWPKRARDNLMLHIPSQWDMVIDNLAIGGEDAVNYASDEKGQMQTALDAHAGSWNIVSSDGGGNDAGLEPTLADYYASTFGQSQPWTVDLRGNCPDTDAMDTTVGNVGSNVHTALANLFAAATTADANVRNIVITYPYILASTNVCEGNMTGSTPQLGAGQVVDDLDGYITTLSTSGVTVVDLRTATGFGSNPMSDIQQTRYFGYPHPNAQGQSDIATAVVAAIPNP